MKLNATFNLTVTGFSLEVDEKTPLKLDNLSLETSLSKEVTPEEIIETMKLLPCLVQDMTNFFLSLDNKKEN